MSDKKQAPAAPATNLFGRENYIWILIGIVVMIIGILLMAGGKSDDPNVFKYEEVYSKTRITVAPILILLGLAIEVYAIFKKPKS
jgi:cadmium resistance protein CadD (predicted permease)